MTSLRLLETSRLYHRQAFIQLKGGKTGEFQDGAPGRGGAIRRAGEVGIPYGGILLIGRGFKTDRRDPSLTNSVS